MNCIKCGRELETDDVFCPLCLEEMERYPVKPGTAVLLPPKKAEPLPKKPPRRRSLTPEETIRKLRRRTRILFGLWIVSLALAIALGFVAHSALGRLDIQKYWGQNYTSSESPSPLPPSSRRP